MMIWGRHNVSNNWKRRAGPQKGCPDVNMLGRQCVTSAIEWQPFDSLDSLQVIVKTDNRYIVMSA